MKTRNKILLALAGIVIVVAVVLFVIFGRGSNTSQNSVKNNESSSSMQTAQSSKTESSSSSDTSLNVGSFDTPNSAGIDADKIISFAASKGYPLTKNPADTVSGYYDNVFVITLNDGNSTVVQVMHITDVKTGTAKHPEIDFSGVKNGDWVYMVVGANMKANVVTDVSQIPLNQNPAASN